MQSALRLSAMLRPPLIAPPLGRCRHAARRLVTDSDRRKVPPPGSPATDRFAAPTPGRRRGRLAGRVGRWNSAAACRRSLQHLELSRMDSTRNLWPSFSWIEDLQNLRSLTLYGGNFSRKSLSSVAKLKSLRSLTISYCSFTRPELSTLGNLVDLRTLEIFNCIFSGPIPSAIGNLTNLRSLKIIECDSLGSIPSSIGNMRNLRNLEINYVNYFYETLDGSSRPLPAAIGNLSNLESLDINYCRFSGPIPDEVGLLKKLTVLRIGQCSLSGRIPNSIVNLT